MSTRRQLLQRSAIAAAMLALGPLLPSLVRAAETLRTRRI
ncbi:twin-arginine translocation signal domain-containing protein, partial [Leclercia adecarboxylata]